MKTQDINRVDIPRDTTVLNEPKKEMAKNPVDLQALRESLRIKGKLISLLEEGGYWKDQDAEKIKNDISLAIADLDKIIKG